MASGRRAVDRPRLAEIAAECDVSIATVSYVLSSRRSISISQTTRERVLATAKRLGYPLEQHLLGARALVRTIGVVLDEDFAEPTAHEEVRYTDDFFAALSRFCGSRSVRLLVYGRPHQEELGRRLWKDDGADGLIVLRYRNEPDILPSIIRSLVPTVDLGSSETRYCVDADRRGAVTLALKHLSELKHTNVWLWREDNEDLSSIQHELAFRQASKGKVVTGYDAPADFLAASDAPTALICSNDRIALRAIREAESRGKAVPKDLSVVTLEGLGLARSSGRRITAVQLPLEEMLDASVNRLEQMAQDQARPNDPVLVPQVLIVGDTTGKR